MAITNAQIETQLTEQKAFMEGLKASNEEMQQMLRQALASNAPATPDPSLVDAVKGAARTPGKVGNAGPDMSAEQKAQLEKMVEEKQLRAQVEQLKNWEMTAALREAARRANRPTPVAELVGTEEGFALSLDIGRAALYVGVAVAIAVTAYGLILLVKEGVAWVAKQWA